MYQQHICSERASALCNKIVNGLERILLLLLFLFFFPLFNSLPHPNLWMLPFLLKNWISEGGESLPTHSQHASRAWRIRGMVHSSTWGMKPGLSACKADLLTTTPWSHPLLLFQGNKKLSEELFCSVVYLFMESVLNTSFVRSKEKNWN
uniref:Uncharacterized protein n=1 Tax=Rousettus aegyptiacus TaxID=9407 RepID=A0A7J8FIA8_ROUAE|nr:hypothetical protein HJG63_011928 [Rousettus aegyptiacus]